MRKRKADQTMEGILSNIQTATAFFLKGFVIRYGTDEIKTNGFKNDTKEIK